ncbi:hypothetical protein SEVIR_5G059900v4 [Setaria viridis]|uniref:Uncharacterized protein n=2 Tax=Setaria TaxID=4554 RepID=K3XPI1_SETIT|nr:hypothetical protein SETIT_5G060300v2 [Setaria italica]TKW12819.1 hypothetical protein SEVIR_5G059900v2 [Setaria viridis]
MASLLLFLRVIVSGNDERLTGEQEEEATLEQRQEKGTFPPPRPATARGRGDAGGAEEEERWVVACMEWPRVDRKSAWMQIV